MSLRIPGPIPVPDDILQEMSQPMINHRGPGFEEILYRVTDRLKQVFETENDLYILTASGTGAMEAAVVNTLSPGDAVLCASAGVFGDRFGQIASIYGADVIHLSCPPEQGVAPERVRTALESRPDVKAVLVVHNETSTGVTNPLQEIAGVVKGEFDRLLLVDGISSVCALPLSTDSWGCDVVATASQKGWMLPPGLAFLSFGERAWRAHAEATMPRFYFDVAMYRRYLEMGQPPYTPSISVMFALDLALEKILSEGLESVFRRHAEIGEATRRGVKEMGLTLFPNEGVASNTVTAVNIPEGVDAARLLRMMREEHGVVLAGGQQSLSGKIFRIGHMGYTTAEEIEGVLTALYEVLPRLSPGQGVFTRTGISRRG